MILERGKETISFTDRLAEYKKSPNIFGSMEKKSYLCTPYRIKKLTSIKQTTKKNETAKQTICSQERDA